MTPHFEDLLQATIWVAGAAGLGRGLLAARRGASGPAAARAALALHAAVSAAAVAGVWLSDPIGDVAFRLFFTAYALATSVLLVGPILVVACLWLGAPPATPVGRRLAAGTALASLAALGFGVYAYRVEPHRLEVSEVVVATPRLPRGVEVRIAHVSDLQFEEVGPHEVRAVETARSLDPDLVVFTGDMAHRRTETALAGARRLFERLAEAAPGRAFAVPGDVEAYLVATWPERGWRTPAEALAAQAEGTGVRVLADEAARVEVNVGGETVGLVVAGLDLGSRAPIDRLLDSAGPADVRLAAAHSPDAVLNDGASAADLVLAGHTHGGQVCLPGGRPITTLTRLGNGHASGLFEVRGTRLYVNRGVGMERSVAPPIRTFCPPEVALVRIVGTGEAPIAVSPPPRGEGG